MWFFIAEGCYYTHDRKKYIARLFILAVISHFAYDFAFGIPFVPLSTGIFNQTSVIWSLAWAVVIVALHDSGKVSTPVEIILTVIISAIKMNLQRKRV